MVIGDFESSWDEFVYSADAPFNLVDLFALCTTEMVVVVFPCYLVAVGLSYKRNSDQPTIFNERAYRTVHRGGPESWNIFLSERESLVRTEWSPFGRESTLYGFSLFCSSR